MSFPFVKARLALALLVAGITTSFGQISFAQTPSRWVPLRLAAAPDAEGAKFFETQVQPILQSNCLRCHNEEKAKGELRLDSREAILKGGASGPAVKLDKPADSLLLKVLDYTGDVQMPPAGKLPKSQIDVLTRWVEMGLPFSEKKEGAHAAAKHSTTEVNEETKKFWSFQPVSRPAVPVVKNAKWVTNPIDSFVLARLEAAGLQPAPPAGKEALLRRAYYDLTGLPPLPGEVRNFLADTAPDAYEKVVDRLLASPQYGERWGRHWLDVVRYAETNSFERDDAKPFVWRYRDYVIKSLNDDKPYDQFLREQLAGDEMPGATPETLIATGYHRLGPWDDEPSDAEQARYDELDDIVSTTGQATLGLTVNCARCHDHKIDPIPQKDYYRFLAFFQGLNRYGVRNAESVAKFSLRPIAPKEEQDRFAAESKEYKERLDELNKQLGDIEKTVSDDFTNAEKEDFKNAQNRIPILKKHVPDDLSQEQFDRYVALTAERDGLAKNPPRGLEQALCVTEAGRVPKTFVLLRGSPQAPADEVQPGFPSVLGVPDPAIAEPAAGAQSSGRRLVLANWIASPQNPLTARVMANRLWQHHFGRGIVRSPNNFGFQGTPPTHPELLDWLAGEFVRGGWKMKALHKLIMLSSAYRMSSQGSAAALAKDPENDLMWRFDMRRLDAEEIRDSILAINGTLNLQGGGPSVYPTIPKEVLAGQSVPGRGWGKSTPEEMARRSVYIHVKRSLAVPLLASFDAADTDFTCPVRFATTQPTQALSMVNSAFTNEQAQILADHLKRQAGPDLSAQVRLGLWRVLQRAPSDKEVARGVNLIRALQKENNFSRDEALRSYCVVLLNLNEFIYLD